MKKIFCVLFALCLMLSGCAKQEDTGANAGATWDCVAYESIDEMNEAAGTNIVSAPVAGKSGEDFCVISNSIAQYQFKVNGEDWCVRASQDVDHDISGLYYDSIDFKKDTTATYYTDEVYAFRFFHNNVQYVISLNVADKDISTTHFDDVCNEFKTNITGVKSGYDAEIIEDGDQIISRTTLYNDDGTTTIMDSIYTFDGDKMVSAASKAIFETEEAAKEYYDLLIEYGRSADEFTLDGTTLSSDNSSALEFYGDMTKDAFVQQMKDALGL